MYAISRRDLDEWQENHDLYKTASMERINMADKPVIAVSELTPAYTSTLSGKERFSGPG